MSNKSQPLSIADQLRDDVLHVLDTLDIAPGIIAQFKKDTQSVRTNEDK